MTNALTSVSLYRLSQARTVERFRSYRASTDETFSSDATRRVDPTHAAHLTANRPHPAYVSAFVAQTIANDNGTYTSSYDAARAYWRMNYRLADLPAGFLISKAV